MREILLSIFNQLLEEPSAHSIKLDRAHRALCPKGASSQPRDILCCVQDFELKERIMVKARHQRTTDFEGSFLQLYPDLSWLTLQKRCHLKPLLSLLRDRDIPYRWGFHPLLPFCYKKWMLYYFPFSRRPGCFLLYFRTGSSGYL